MEGQVGGQAEYNHLKLFYTNALARIFNSAYAGVLQRNVARFCNIPGRMLQDGGQG
jgi:hypothetical protein